MRRQVRRHGFGADDIFDLLFAEPLLRLRQQIEGVDRLAHRNTAAVAIVNSGGDVEREPRGSGKMGKSGTPFRLLPRRRIALRIAAAGRFNVFRIVGIFPSPALPVPRDEVGDRTPG